MITTRKPELIDYLIVAQKVSPEEQEAYYELTGANFIPDNVAAQLWVEGGERWAFINRHHETIAVGGYTPCGFYAYQSWFMATPAAWEQHGRELTDAVRDVIAGMRAREGVRRLVTTTLASRTKVRAWYERLGLTYESTACKTSASGYDVVTYVAVKP